MSTSISNPSESVLSNRSPLERRETEILLHSIGTGNGEPRVIFWLNSTLGPVKLQK